MESKDPCILKRYRLRLRFAIENLLGLSVRGTVGILRLRSCFALRSDHSAQDDTTCGGACGCVLLVFYGDHRASFPFVELEDFFTQAQRLGGDFDVFIVGDELDGLFQVQIAEGNQADGHVGS
jgi:hypothetical protein